MDIQDLRDTVISDLTPKEIIELRDAVKQHPVILHAILYHIKELEKEIAYKGLLDDGSPRMELLARYAESMLETKSRLMQMLDFYNYLDVDVNSYIEALEKPKAGE